MNKIENKSSRSLPNSELNKDSQLGEILFELSDLRLAKIIFAVADPDVQTEQNFELVDRAHLQGVPFKTISADKLRPSRLLAFLISAAAKGSGLSITNIAGISSGRRTQLIAALNVHRDAILSLPLGLVLWVTSEELYQVAARAPDFWSRRTAVIQFESHPAAQLIDKLFKESPIPRETWTGEDDLAECLELILAKEAQIKECQTVTSELGISRAKEAQVALLEASERLLEVATSERKIELSLWLWNLAQVDAVLQDFLQRLDIQERRSFESIYLDRNEVLLDLAEKMETIVRSYRDLIQRGMGKRTRISILALYIQYANKHLTRITDELASLKGYQNSIEVHDEEPLSSKAIYSRLAAEELERWLTGETTSRPTYLTAHEGNVLRQLYSGAPVLEQASQFGATEEEMMRYIERLETKVRLVLGRASKAAKQEAPVG